MRIIMPSNATHQDRLEKLAEAYREYIRENGFATASQLIVEGVVAFEGRSSVPIEALKLICDNPNFHQVEYCNELTEGYRSKDLFYYYPLS